MPGDFLFDTDGPLGGILQAAQASLWHAARGNGSQQVLQVMSALAAM